MFKRYLHGKTDTFLGIGKPRGTNSQLIVGSKGDPFNPTSSKISKL